MSEIWLVPLTDAELAIAAALHGFTATTDATAGTDRFDDEALYPLADAVAEDLAAIQASFLGAKSWAYDPGAVQLVADCVTYDAWSLAVLDDGTRGVRISSRFGSSGVTDTEGARRAAQALAAAGYGTGTVHDAPHA